MRDLYEKLKRKFAEIDFNDLWPDFTPYEFALFDGKEVLYKNKVRPWDNRFYGNTAIKYNDEWIAIYDVRLIPDGMDVNRICSSMIHEMFHCFQMENKEQKYPNEILGMDYPITVENQVLKYQELNVLYDAFKEKGQEKRKQLLNEFIIIRLKRESLLGEYIQYEYALESVEGLAMYIELNAYNALTSKEQGFKAFFNDIKEINSDLLKTRHNSFLPGALIAYFLNELQPYWKLDFMKQDKYSIDLLKELVSVEEDKIIVDKMVQERLSEIIDRRNQEIELYITDVINNKHHHLKGEFYLTGFDPMNLYKKGNTIYHKLFVKIRKDDDEEFINGPVVTVHDPCNIFCIYEIYYLK